MTSLRARSVVAATLVALLLAGCVGPRDDPGSSAGEVNRGGADDGRPAALAAEAGFIDVPGSKTLGPGWPSRMFYSFLPAEVRPERAPIIVFFNGGPGAATTSILLPYGTGHHTLDPAGPADAAPVVNDASYTRFANLLYVDARSTGFSYERASVRPSDCHGEEQLYIADAADFIFVLLEFLDAHEALRDNPVVIAGESYGGTRAAVMLYMMQHYTLRADGLEVMGLAPPWLKGKMQAHLDAAFPARAGAPRAPAQVAEQFGWQVLIQPSLFGVEQAMYEEPLARADPDLAGHFADPGARDRFDVRRTVEEGELVAEHAARSMRNAEHLEALLGVGLTEIAGLTPPERWPSSRYFWSGNEAATAAASERALRAELGGLGADDAYWLAMGLPCQGYLGDHGSLRAFGEILPHTATFITNARHDAAVYTEALPVFFAERSIYDVAIDMSLPAGAARPGVVRLTSDGADIALRFPTYESGHAVSVGAPRELAADVEAWLAETGASARR
ncbi:S10 family serine carboxypeptidase-like protein [Sorangium sp. So ce1335]|uniref:S10 family serine carboxypeptidase-like protein n=1 Tax=Sorangium sp. So ce1335 TaxID=3133335 RepID=UPI003F6427A0